MSLARAPKFSSFVTGGILAAVMGASVFLAQDASAASTGFRQAVAEMAWEDDAVASYYRQNDYAPIWTADTPESAARRRALMQALEEASMHGLPDMSVRASELVEQMLSVRSTRDLGAV
ncbi:MAG: murein L,D-transpeptidase, partial [Tritonibacter mobilis]|nr:murein L,D-transpeptidase [Tritonibacter mobilis]